jgi:hypothetical protein
MKLKTNYGSFNIWAKKRFGIVSVQPVNMRAIIDRILGQRVLANAAEGRHPHGMLSAWPIDYTLYTTRYLAVSYAASGAQSALAPAVPYATSIPDGVFVHLLPTSRLEIPLGIMTDEVSTSLDVAPFQGAVQLLGGAGRATLYGITDGVVPFNTLLVGSSTTAGQLTSLPATPGSYWSLGLSLSTSEGAGAQIEFDPRPQVVNVDVIT